MMTFCTMHATRPPPPSSLIQQCRPGTIAAHSTHPRQFSRACTASQHNFVTNFSTSGIRSPQNRRSKRRSSVVTYMGIRAIETYDSAFQLEPEAETKLKDLLRKPTFCAQVAKECSLAEGIELNFTEMLFQPVPWSATTRKGMPAEIEVYHDDPDYTIINVPPNFMFTAKIFKPSRLCAIFKRI